MEKVALEATGAQGAAWPCAGTMQSPSLWATLPCWAPRASLVSIPKGPLRIRNIADTTVCASGRHERKQSQCWPNNDKESQTSEIYISYSSRRGIAWKPRDFSGTAQVTARSRDENRGAPAARVHSPSFRHGSPSSWAPRHSLGAQPPAASCSHSFLRHPWGSRQLGGFRTARLGTRARPRADCRGWGSAVPIICYCSSLTARTGRERGETVIDLFL